MDALDQELILLLASSSASLAETKEKDNWIEHADGNLPPYVRKLARGIMKSGKTKSQAIAIAISRIKKWAAGGDDVDPDTRAKAAKALAQWEALKAKNKAKKLVKASRLDGSSYVMLSDIGSFNTDMVRRAWSSRFTSEEREAMDYDYGYITELWTDHIIVEHRKHFEKIPYTVEGSVVHFGEPTVVEHAWVETDELTPAEQGLLSDVLVAFSGSALDSIRELARR